MPDEPCRSGTITAISPQTRNGQRVNVFVDGRFAFGISLATLAHEGLYVGQHLDTAAWAHLEAVAETERAVDAAMRLLAVRPRSIAEVRQRLRRKRLDPGAIERAIERLRALALLDDAAFSRFLIEQRQTFHPRSIRALRAELRQKGVDHDTINTVLATQASTVADEQACALAAARTVLHRYASIPDRTTFNRRLGGWLRRRGFDMDAIAPILAILWNERESSS